MKPVTTECNFTVPVLYLQIMLLYTMLDLYLFISKKATENKQKKYLVQSGHYTNIYYGVVFSFSHS